MTSPRTRKRDAVHQRGAVHRTPLMVQVRRVHALSHRVRRQCQTLADEAIALEAAVDRIVIRVRETRVPKAGRS
jgi:hypothetical protein